MKRNADIGRFTNPSHSGRQGFNQLPQVKAGMADGGGHIGSMIGENAAQVAVQNDPRVEFPGPLAGDDGVVQQFGAVSLFQCQQKIMVDGLQYGCHGTGHALGVEEVVVHVEGT